jgi:hypothetical protein
MHKEALKSGGRKDSRYVSDKQTTRPASRPTTGNHTGAPCKFSSFPVNLPETGITVRKDTAEKSPFNPEDDVLSDIISSYYKIE